MVRTEAYATKVECLPGWHPFPDCILPVKRKLYQTYANGLQLFGYLSRVESAQLNIVVFRLDDASGLAAMIQRFEAVAPQNERHAQAWADACYFLIPGMSEDSHSSSENQKQVVAS